MKTKKNPYGIYNNKVFITVKGCGINFLILLCDGVCLHRFAKCKDTFISLDDCIAWYKKELPFVHYKRKKIHDDMLIALKKSRENFERCHGGEK